MVLVIVGVIVGVIVFVGVGVIVFVGVGVGVGQGFEEIQPAQLEKLDVPKNKVIVPAI